MRVIVLGSGLLGVTTAYVLASRGHQVEVIDRQDKSAAETSFANGGQLSYSHAEPWASPHVLRKLPKWLLHADSPLYFRPRADMAMVKWGLRFLSNCTPARVRKNTLAMLRLGLYSREKMLGLMAETNVKFDYLNKGILHTFFNQKDFDLTQRQAEFQAKFGCDQTLLSAAEALALEPALGHSERKMVGALHSHMDASGDPHLFCNNLAAYCTEKLGVVFHYGTNITSLESDGEKITAVITDKDAFWADAYVMALGSYVTPMLKHVGIDLPIYPMKGYSITLPHNAASPTLSVTDGSNKIVLSRLGDRLRIAGTAEFAGYNTEIVPARIAPIERAARSLFPNADWESGYSSWACLRPSTPDGPPIIGRSKLSNLFLNTGHGTLGWTQAAGSAYVVADIMENRPPEIMTTGLAWEDA